MGRYSYEAEAVVRDECRRDVGHKTWSHERFLALITLFSANLHMYTGERSQQSHTVALSYDLCGDLRGTWI